MSTYQVTIPVVITVEAEDEQKAIAKASFTIGHGVHYVYHGNWVATLDDQATVTTVFTGDTRCIHCGMATFVDHGGVLRHDEHEGEACGELSPDTYAERIAKVQ